MSTAHDFLLHLRAAYLRMHRRGNALFEEHGITADQFVLIAALKAGGDCTQRELTDRIHSDQSTVRVMLDRLEEAKLIARTPHPTDRRATLVTLAPEGRKAHARLTAFNEKYQADLLALFTPSERNQLMEYLDRITHYLSETPKGT